MAKQPTNLRDRLINGDPLTGENTDYRSLKYPNSDKKNGQPFITQGIPDVESNEPTINTLGGVANNLLDASVFNGSDFLLRTGAGQRSILDAERLGKFFTTTPGLLFAAKQNILSSTNVKPQGAGVLGQGAYLSTNTLAQAGVSAFGGSLVKQGLDPFRNLDATPRPDRQEPKTGLGKVTRAVGDFLSTVNDATTFPLYLEQVSKGQAPNSNRLVQLKDAKISSTQGQAQGALDFASSLVNNITQGLGGNFSLPGLRGGRDIKNKLSKVADTISDIGGILEKNNISRDKGEILKYSGGPGSYLGVVGSTIIKRSSDTTAYRTPEFLRKYPDLDTSEEIAAKADTLATNESGEIIPELLATRQSVDNKLISLYDKNISGLTQGQADALNNNVFSEGGLTEQIFKQPNTDGFLSGLKTPVKKASDVNKYNTDDFKKKNYLLNSQQIKAKAFEVETKPATVIQDFRKDLLEQQDLGQKKNILSSTPDYTSKNIERRVNLGDPGTPYGKDLKSYSFGSGLGPVDQVNALPLYESNGVTANRSKNDLVKFRIAAPDTDNPAKKTYIHFRAFLDGMVDNFNSSWNETRLMGRTDPMFRFSGYTRSVVMSWTIAAQSREELMVMYTKLNYLQSLMAGDYTSKGYMAGNVINMTVGGYFWETPCVINSMNITIPNESPWEIAISDGVKPSERNLGQTIDTDTSVREMPHIIQVTGFSFTPIHGFAPRKQKNIYDSNGQLTQFGQQKFISLTSETGNSIYDSDVKKERPELSFNPTTTTTANAITPIGKKPYATTGIQAKPLNIPRPAGLTPSVEVGQGDFGSSPDTGRNFSVNATNPIDAPSQLPID